MQEAIQGIRRYQPLLVLLIVVAVGALGLHLQQDSGFMRYFMGLFFTIFAMFKLFDLQGFVKGFAKYDIPTQRHRAYGYAYPFLELGLGFLYLADLLPALTQLATILLMAVSAAGVIREIRRGNKFQCACLGTTLNVPLSTVSIVENLSMGAMAALMLAGVFHA